MPHWFQYFRCNWSSKSTVRICLPMSTPKEVTFESPWFININNNNNNNNNNNSHGFLCNPITLFMVSLEDRVWKIKRGLVVDAIIGRVELYTRSKNRLDAPSTTVDRRNPVPPGMYQTLINKGLNYLSTGAGFLPSTVVASGDQRTNERFFFPVQCCWGFQRVSLRLTYITLS